METCSAYAALIEFLAQETLRARNTRENIRSGLFPPLRDFLDLVSRGILKSSPSNSSEDVRSFVERAAQAVIRELEEISSKDASIIRELGMLIQKGEKPDISDSHFRELLWSVFSKEAAELSERQSSRENKEQDIRMRRIVHSIVPNPCPVIDPCKEVLFTSNVLITLPADEDIDTLSLPDSLRNKLREIALKPQLYWYDHPMPIGINPEANELLHGLRGLSEMLDWEKKQGGVAPEARLRVLLSVSVTHQELAALARSYISHEMEQAGTFPGLEVYVVSEDETQEIAGVLEELIDLPEIIGAGGIEGKDVRLTEIFGVNGMYGRHYSFLKAAAPLWRCIDKDIRATFKIDLDQVFPQRALQSETGKTALSHLCTPLWGAKGIDADGTSVELGMIAGSLVNEKDIAQGLFTPDVQYPDEPLSPEQIFFPREYLMALSTRAEMKASYCTGAVPDGKDTCLQRVHVTGGTNGILLDSLLRHRPFTPSFVGRAEDQAYLMSVHSGAVNSTEQSFNYSALRYVHAPGLIMRHDKSSFASAAIQRAKPGTFAGDLLRTIVFSYYADCLPGGLARFKQHFQPFTSCFANSLPFATCIARLLLYCNTLYQQKGQAETQLNVAMQILSSTLDGRTYKKWIQKHYQRERVLWDAYYDALEKLFSEKNHTSGGREAKQIENARSRIRDILLRCRIDCR